jgi:hypothetical protein
MGILAALVLVVVAARLLRFALRIAVDIQALYLVVAVLRHPGNIRGAVTAQWRELAQVLPEAARWAAVVLQRLFTAVR